jgi:tyrocidine synthetase III
MNASSIEDICPLSPLQEGFLFQSLYDPDPEAYFVQMNFRCRGELQPGPFRDAWLMLSARHGVLRSAFLHEGLSRPAQVVLKQRPPEITFIDLRRLAPEERQRHIEQFRRQDRRRGFNLARDLLMRIAVFQTQPDEHHVLWSFHHILIDGWSLNILQREFVQIYTALIGGQVLDLPTVFPYGNYLRWLESQDREEARRYWREYLSGYQGLAGVPRISRSSKDDGYALRELMLELDADTTAALRAVAARAGVTFNTLVQCVWAIVLARYNDVPEVVFGIIVSGRPPDLAGVEQMLGLCINTVPVRIRLEPEHPFTGLLQSVQKAALESQRRHHLSLAEIQAQSRVGGELFDHLLTFENYPVEHPSQKTGEPGGDTFAIEPLGAHDRTHYPFTFIATPGKSLHVRFSFNANIYPEDQIRRTRDHFLTAVRSLLENPDLSVEDINILPAAEQRQLLHDFNDARVERAYEPGLVLRFETQVRRTPEHTAVICEDRQLTYQELNERANHLAHYLRDAHLVQPDERVGLLLDRSEFLPVAVWGILKAGAAYVPIDPGMPRRRMQHMLTDSACRLVVSESRYAEQARDGTAAEVIDIRRVPPGSRENPTPLGDSRNLAYVIYTSGSTGLPKGCQIELGNLVHYLSWADRYYFQDGAGGTFGLYSPVSFDLTVTSLFLPLLRGKALHVFPSDAELLDIFQHTFSEDSPLDSIKLTPSHISLLRYLRVSRSNVRLAIVGGEALSLEQVQMLRSLNPQMEIYNEYGPTETTVGCVVKRMEVSDERVLIGKPIADTRIYVMRDGNLVPIGITGEVLIGGAGVGRGYIHRDELNRRAFVEDPFRPGQRVYRTGDLGRWLPDGNLELLGRNDQQVKIRGYRVELGEIENALLRQAGVREAVIVKRDSALVAYIAGDDALDEETIPVRIASVLPTYMVPTQFVRLNKLPLSPNGKIDRKALPDPGGTRRAAHTAPRTDSEERILQVWRKVLDVEEIGIDENFFELGGHSLKAMQVSSRIYRELGIRIRLRDFMERPTIAALAAWVDGAERTKFCAIEPAPEAESYELSHAQQRLWLLHQMGGASAYNMPLALLFEVPLDLDALRRAFITVIERHEALRTAFVLVDGEPRQKVFREAAFTLRELDLSTEPRPEGSACQLAAQEALAPFDLTQPPLLRATVARLDAERSLFLFTIHHIVGDGWSGNVLYREVLSLFDAYCRGEPDPLTPLRIQYKDFAAWQNRQSFVRQERYWLGKLADAPERLALPYDFAPGEGREFKGDFLSATLGPEVLHSFRAIATARATTVSNVVLAIFKLLLFQLTRQRDFCVGMSVANRNHPDLENIIGFFVNILPIRTQFVEEMDFEALLDQVTQSTTEAFEEQDYPFDLLVRKLNPHRLADLQPIVNVLYGFQNFEDVHIDLGFQSHAVAAGARFPRGSAIEHVRPFGVFSKTSKFDLTLFVSEQREGIVLTIEFDTALFRPKSIRRYLLAFERFARKVCNEITPPFR